MKRIFWLIPLLLASCSKDFVPEPNAGGDAPDAANALPTEVAVIGKKIQNPYSLSVMRHAYENLSPATRGSVAPQDIEATHLYVMFKPSNDKELNAILMQDGIFWYLYPLDYEVSDGWIELDPRPEFSTNGYQHRWAYVPVGRDLSNIDCPYEVLDEIYDPDEDTATRSGVMPTEEFLDAMEVEAHRLCGIDLEPVESTRASQVTPFGKITF